MVSVDPAWNFFEFYYLKRYWDFDRDASGVICRKLQMVSGL